MAFCQQNMAKKYVQNTIPFIFIILLYGFYATCTYLFIYNLTYICPAKKDTQSRLSVLCIFLIYLNIFYIYICITNILQKFVRFISIPHLFQPDMYFVPALFLLMQSVCVERVPYFQSV